MKRPVLILAAAGLDAVIGDPESLPHPVRAIGFAIHHGENLLRSPRRSNTYDLAAGTILTLAITCGTYQLSLILLKQAAKLHPYFGGALELLLASTCLAARNLDDEARKVLEALESNDLPLARKRLSRIVGRDTASLDQPAICRALIETLAEGASDGIVAPVFYLALGGVPLALAFKAISTLDSMIGHRDQRYLYFGRAAARLDDVANLLPSRLTASILLALAPQRLPASLNIWRGDARKHASPNAGHPEAAIAAILNIQLGGPSTYAGEPRDAPLLNENACLPTPADARRALNFTRATTAVIILTAFAFTLIIRRKRP